MKIYRSKTNPKIVGVKFDGHWGTPKIQVEADGNIDTVVEFKFVTRSREEGFDFNSEPDFVKDYDTELTDVLLELLGADASDKTKRYCVKQLGLNPVAVAVTVAEANDKIAVGDINETIDRLSSYLSSAIH